MSEERKSNEGDKVLRLPPIKVFMVWGQKGMGKTTFGITSPYRPVLVLDTENSSHLYHVHGIGGSFDRIDCLGMDWAEFGRAVQAIPQDKYKTIVLDTAGEVGEMAKVYHFTKPGANPEKQSMLLWGEVRKSVRNLVVALLKKCEVLIVTAHARTDYNAMRAGRAKLEERVHGAFLELADVSIQVVRDPNQKVPYGIVGERNRGGFLPPKITPLTWDRILHYCFNKPPDWDNLQPDEMLKPEEIYVTIRPELLDMGEE